MSISEVDPCNYFSSVHLLESEPVRFRMSPSQSQLDIVVIYGAEAIGAYFLYLQAGGLPENYKCDVVDFRLFRFRGVENLRKKLGPNVPADRTPQGDSDSEWAAYETLVTSRHRSITAFRCKRSKSGYQCHMYFDSFGEHQWKFQRLLVDCKIAQIYRRGKLIEYTDKSTGQIIDPSNPFVGDMQ